MLKCQDSAAPESVVTARFRRAPNLGTTDGGIGTNTVANNINGAITTYTYLNSYRTYHDEALFSVTNHNNC